MAHVRFVHTSDLQLGMTRWFLEGEAQARFGDARLRTLGKLSDLAVAQECDFIVIAGDVFEHNSLHDTTLQRSLEALSRVAVPVYLLPGNHDPLVADSIFSHTDDIPGVHVIRDSEPIDVNGVQLVGAPLLSRTAATDLVRQALQPLSPTSDIRIAVGHGATRSFGDDRLDVIDHTYVESRLADGSIDYLALGDTHSTLSVGESGRIWYSGSPETTDFHDLTPGSSGLETDSGNALVVDITKSSATDSQVTVEPVPTGEWTFEALSAHLGSADDVDEFLATLRAYPRKETTVVKYALTGVIDLAATMRLNRGLDELRPRFAALYERRRLMDLHLAPSTDEISELGVTGYPAAALAELLDSREQAAQDAVHLMFRLMKAN